MNSNNRMEKGISELLTSIILFAIIVAAIAIVISSSQPTLETAFSTEDIKNAETIMKTIDNNIKEAAHEGPNATRVLGFTAPKTFETVPEEDAIQFKTVSSSFEYLSRIIFGNLIYIAGDDVGCSESDGDGDGDTDLVMENQYIKAVLLSVPKSTPYVSYDTANTIFRLTEKTSSNTVTLANSSVIIDDNLTTTSGNGYSEISNAGQNLPSCQAHFFMNSTAADYDIYYKLYAGADFLVVDVRNIR